MKSPSDPDTLVRIIAGVGIVVAGIMFVVWWRLWTEDRVAQRAALPACIAKLGSEKTCEEHFHRNHRTCFNYNNKAAGRYTPRVFDKEGYLECIVQGPDEWVASTRAENARRNRGEKAGVPPLP